MRHDSNVQYTEYLHTAMAIIIIDVAFYQVITVVIRGTIRYVVCGQVQIASNLIYLHALSSANE